MSALLLLISLSVLMVNVFGWIGPAEVPAGQGYIDNKCCFKDFRVQTVITHSHLVYIGNENFEANDLPEWVTWTEDHWFNANVDRLYNTHEVQRHTNQNLGTFNHQCEKTQEWCDSSGTLYQSLTSSEWGYSWVKCAYKAPFLHAANCPGEDRQERFRRIHGADLFRRVGCIIRNANVGDQHCLGYIKDDKCQSKGIPCVIELPQCASGIHGFSGLVDDEWAYVDSLPAIDPSWIRNNVYEANRIRARANSHQGNSRRFGPAIGRCSPSQHRMGWC